MLACGCEADQGSLPIIELEELFAGLMEDVDAQDIELGSLHFDGMA